MNTPDYKDMRQMMLSQIATACRKCGDRYVDTGGQVQCRRPECPIHSVRAQAQAMNTTAFGSHRS